MASLLGAGVSAACITALLFGRIAPIDGRVGALVVWYGLSLATYALLLSFGEEGPALVDKVMSVAFATAAAVAFAALFSVIWYTFWRGREALWHPSFYIDDMSSAGPADPLGVGGVGHALVGTLIITSLSLLMTVPLGVTCAVFLNESRSRAARVVRTVVDAMIALPSVLAGLFVFAAWILVLGFERSGLAAAIAQSIVMLPIVIRSADVVLRLVPGNLREAAAALGAPQWRGVRHVVLPTARSGLTTAVILGVARGIGETAPVLLTAGFTSTLNVDPASGPMVSLPLASYEFVRAPQEALVKRGFATAAVLLLLVLVLFALARLVGGRPPDQVRPRRARRLTRRSAKDLARIEALAAHPEELR